MADFSVGIVGLDSLGVGAHAPPRRTGHRQHGHRSQQPAPAGAPRRRRQRACGLALRSGAGLRPDPAGGDRRCDRARGGARAGRAGSCAPPRHHHRRPERYLAAIGSGAGACALRQGRGMDRGNAGRHPQRCARRQADAVDRRCGRNARKSTPVLSAFAAKILRLGDLGTGPLAKALASALGALSIAIHTEMLVAAKKAGLDPAGLLGALALLSPGAANAAATAGAQVLSGRYESSQSSKRLQEDIGRVLDAAGQAAAPMPFHALLQAGVIAAGHSPHATGSALDVARWMADNAGIEFGAAT